jgi:hypothetical protein
VQPAICWKTRLYPFGTRRFLSHAINGVFDMNGSNNSTVSDRSVITPENQQERLISVNVLQFHCHIDSQTSKRFESRILRDHTPALF